MGFRDYLTTAPLRLILADMRRERPGAAVTIYLRDSSFGPDTLSLVTQVSDSLPDWDIYLVVRSPKIFEKTSRSIVPRLKERGANVIVVEEHSRAFVRGLVDSSLVFFTTRYDLWNYRLCNRTQSRTFIRIHHGIITKAYGNLRTKNLERQRRSRSNKLRYPSRLMPLSTVGVDAQSIESEVERYFRVAAEGKKPSLFRPFGYPRYDRIRALRSGTATPIVPEQSLEELENDGAAYRFLYAPTHKDNAYETTLFPFDGFDIDRFRDVLAERDAVLYVRMHPLEDDEGIYDEYIDGELIRYAGTTFAQSPIEILPYFDALVTDYSSIYVDFLPFDGPIVFLKDDHEAFLETRGLAFDYDRYFPGEKIDESEAFLGHLERCIHGDEGYEDQRAFVRQVFLPEREETFLEAVFDEFSPGH